MANGRAVCFTGLRNERFMVEAIGPGSVADERTQERASAQVMSDVSMENAARLTVWCWPQQVKYLP
jgi:hypothetical protein